MVPVVKNPPATEGDARDMGSTSGSGRLSRRGNGQPLLPGESPWTEESGGLQPMGPQRVRCHGAHTQSYPEKITIHGKCGIRCIYTFQFSFVKKIVSARRMLVQSYEYRLVY